MSTLGGLMGGGASANRGRRGRRSTASSGGLSGIASSLLGRRR
jgi:hypothetical protein